MGTAILFFLNHELGCTVTRGFGYCYGSVHKVSILSHKVQHSADRESFDGIVTIRYSSITRNSNGNSNSSSNDGSISRISSSFNSGTCRAAPIINQHNRTYAQSRLSRHYRIGRSGIAAVYCRHCPYCVVVNTKIQPPFALFPAVYTVAGWFLCFMGCLHPIVMCGVVQRVLKVKKKGECEAYKPMESIWDIDVGVTAQRELLQREKEREEVEVEGNAV